MSQSRKMAMLIAAVLVIFTTGNVFAQTCKPVTGRISPLQQVPCATGLCFQGTSTGNFSGSFQSMLNGEPSLISPNTFVFTATTILTARKGSVTFADAGVITDPFSPHSAEVLTIIGGRGDYTTASGHVFITGDYVPAFAVGQTAGQGFGELSGQICTS